jgi:hypothetical protein
MDCTEQHIVIASAPLELLVLQLEGSPAAAATSRPAAAAGGASGKSPAGTGSGQQKARLVAVRELSLFNVGRPIAGVALVSAAAADMAHKALRGAQRVCVTPGVKHWHSERPRSDVSTDAVSSCCAGLRPAGYFRGPGTPGSGSSGSTGRAVPSYAVLLRWGGMLSVLDLSRGAELMLADEVRVCLDVVDRCGVQDAPAMHGITCARGPLVLACEHQV